MARARNIKPSFFINDTLAESNCPLGRLLFIGMWTIADCNGNFEWRPARIKAQVLPYDDCDIQKLAINLDKSGFIRFYSVQGKLLVNIPTFLDHQNPHKNEREKGGAVDGYDEKGRQLIDLKTLTINRDKSRAEPEDSQSDPADSLILIPDSLILNPDCGNGAGAPDGDVPPPAAKTITKAVLANEFSVDPQVAADYLQVRKAKKSPLTQTAWKSLINEFSKAGLSVPDGVRVCVERGWVGFKASWDWKDQEQTNSHSGFDDREYTDHIPEWAQEGGA